MNFIFSKTAISIGRDVTDKRVPKESTLVYRVLKALNSGLAVKEWVRYYPDRHGLTACKLGIKNVKTNEVYWHERYAVEMAHEEYNKKSVVSFCKA